MPEPDLFLLFVRPLNRAGMSGEQLDHSALTEWIQRRGLEPQWKQVSI